jgi:hypothetical protein
VRDAAGRGPVTCQRLGRYAFILRDLIARGELRPFRNPAIVDDES